MSAMTSFCFKESHLKKEVKMSSAVLCLALAVFYESRGEPLRGQQAVAEVIVNRSESKKYPSDVCSVIKQQGQFSWYSSNISLNKPPVLIYRSAQAQKSWEQAKDVAHQALNEPTNHTRGALFFNSTRLGVRYRTDVRPCKIGNHIFY